MYTFKIQFHRPNLSKPLKEISLAGENVDLVDKLIFLTN